MLGQWTYNAEDAKSVFNQIAEEPRELRILSSKELKAKKLLQYAEFESAEC